MACGRRISDSEWTYGAGPGGRRSRAADVIKRRSKRPKWADRAARMSVGVVFWRFSANYHGAWDVVTGMT